MKKIIILTPALPESLKGNGITALRYKGIFETLGYDVVISTDFVDQPFDIVLAIHAVKSYESFRRYHDTYPGIKKILVLGGTDIYESRFRDGNRFKSSVDIADVVVGLERNVSTNFGTQDASKLKIITQSVDGIEISNTPPTRNFLNLIMTGHIRPGKNHFFVVEVTKNLPVEIQKRIKITHVGRALSEEAEKQAE